MRCGRGGWTLWNWPERAIEFMVGGNARFGGGRLIKVVFLSWVGKEPFV